MIDYSEIKHTVPPVEAAKRYGSVKRGFVRCPFHADRTPSLKLYGDHFHCFGCGAHGDVIDLTAALLGCSKSEAAKRLEADFGDGGFVPPLGLAACTRRVGWLPDGRGREPGRNAAGRAENRAADGGFAWLNSQNGTMVNALTR